MPDSMIECPKCGEQIPLTNAIEGPMRERLRAEFDKANAARDAEAADKLKAERRKILEQAEAKLAGEMVDLRGQLAEQNKKLETAQATEMDLRKQRRDLEQQKESLALEVARRIDEERAKIKAETQKSMAAEYQRKELETSKQVEAMRLEVAAAQRRAETVAAKEKELAAAQQGMDEQVARQLKTERERITAEAAVQAKEAQAAEMGAMQSRLKEKEEKLAAAQKLELELRKQRADLDEQKRELELKTARTIDEERGKIRAEAVKTADETHRLKEKEAEMQLTAMRRQIDELKQKAEQGSQQLQGEVLELELEAMLRTAFPHDEITPVAKGVHGGDVVQRVRTPAQLHCGTILWETKRTKSWSDEWVDKLKMNQRAAKADVAVIVSIAMPRDCQHMGNVNGIWVASHGCMMGMVLALRDGLLRLASAKRAEEGKHEKMEVLYAYFSGQEFKQRVEAIKEAFVTMRKELEAEKTAMTKIWAKREKQLERVMLSTAGMQGDLAGIIGGAMPEIAAFELKTLAQADE